MNSITVGSWTILVEDGSLPSSFESYLEHAEFVDQFDLNSADGRLLFLGISQGEASPSWPSVVIAQKYKDAHQAFRPNILLIPDTSLVFVGAGGRLLCYNIEEHRRLWEDETLCGFWAWSQSGPYVLMSAELEFGVWSQSGEKLWSTFVEPPWSFAVKNHAVELDVMGDTRTYRLSDGTQIA